VLTMAMLLLSAVLLTGPGLWLAKRAVLGRPRAKWWCWCCRFDLRASPPSATTCPECGSAIVTAGQRPPTSRAERASASWLGALCLLPAAQVLFVAGSMALRSPVVAKWFPGFALDRAPVGSSVGWQALEATGQIVRSFAAGGATEDALRSAVHRIGAELATESGTTLFPPDPDLPQAGAPEVASALGGEGLAAVASVLDDRSLSEAVLDTLIDALADAFETHPVRHSTNIDFTLRAMLAGSWPEKHSSGSSDYRSAHALPRELTFSQRRRLIDMVLTIQADRSYPWNTGWGGAFEAALAKGLATPADLDRYLNQAFLPVLEIDGGTSLRQGDSVQFRVLPQWRAGPNIPVFMRAMPVAGPMSGRVSGRVCIGEVTSPGWSSSELHTGMLFLPDSVGLLTVDLEAAASFGPDVIDARKASVNPWYYADEEPGWRAMPATTVVKHVLAEIMLNPSRAPPTVVNSMGLAPEAIMAGLRHWTALYDAAGDRLAFEVHLSLARPPLDLAFDVFLRQDGVDHQLGWLFAYRAGMGAAAVAGRVDGLDPSRPIDLVLRSNRGPVERSFWAPVIWEGELVLPGVMPRRRLRPAQFGG